MNSSKMSRRLRNRISANKMPPEQLSRHSHWISNPRKFYGGSIPDPEYWGNYLRGVREYFVITPELGMVLIINQKKGQPDVFHYSWGYGRLPEGACMIKASETFGLILTSLVAMYAPPFFESEFEDFQPLIDTLKVDPKTVVRAQGIEEFAKFAKRADDGFKKFQLTE